MKSKTIASTFNGVIILSVIISVSLSSFSITGYLLHRFTNDMHEKDMLHIKGLAGTVKGFVDQAFSVNYQLSINPIIINAVRNADPEWDRRVRKYNTNKDITVNSVTVDSGMPFLVSIQQSYNFIELIFVQDSAGDQVARSFGPLGHRGSRWWFKKVMAAPRSSQPFFSKSYYSMTGDSPVASAFHPLYSDGEFMGVIGTDINFEKLQELAQNYLDSKDLHAIVIDNQGVIIAHPNHETLREMYHLKKLTRHVLMKDDSGKSIQDENGYHQTQEVPLNWPQDVSGVVSNALNGGSGVVEDIVLEDAPTTLYYEPVALPGSDHQNYAVIMIRNNSSVQKAKLTICIFVFLFMLAVILMLIFLLRFRVNRVILLPLKQFIKSMQNIDESQHTDVTLNTNDEFQVMARTYNEMRKRLADTNTELIRLNQELEQHVGKRTEQLREANEQLRKDIRIRMQVEDALRESEDKYRLLAENANDAIFIIQDNQITFSNPKAKELGRRIHFQNTDDAYYAYIHPEERDMVIKRHEKLILGEEVSDLCSFRLNAPDGDEIWVQLNDVRIQWGGRAATLNFLRDITTQHRLERHSQQVRRMDAIGTLVGGIAHNFNNLLMGIQGNLSIMQIDNALSDGHRDEFKSMQRCIDNGAKLTKQLLGFAREGKYVVTTINPNTIVEQMAHFFGQSQKGIQIERHYAPDVWMIRADQGQLELVLMNIYVNASQAMNGFGTLILRTSNADVNEQYAEKLEIKAGRYVKLSITDTGVGMDNATLSKIFEPFFSTKNEQFSSGLGLASAFGIIKNHGGFIDVESAVGRGSRFDIYLPASIERNDLKDEITTQIHPGSETILIIDDETIVTDTCFTMLTYLGYHVLIANSGKDGIDIFTVHKDKIDLVILDFVMPDMSGGIIFEKIRKIRPHTKILLISGYSVDAQADAILKRGCDGFVQKPFNIEKLTGIIRKIIDDTSI